MPKNSRTTGLPSSPTTLTLRDDLKEKHRAIAKDLGISFSSYLDFLMLDAEVIRCEGCNKAIGVNMELTQVEAHPNGFACSHCGHFHPLHD